MKLLGWSAALATGLFSNAGFAQVETANADTASEDRIIVTAQRREQSPQDVGVALNVFSGAELIDQGIDRINGLENASPNLEIENQFGSGQPSFSIRGVGFRDYATNNTPTVGVYVDDVAYPIPVMTQGVLFDVERVEVLRGPQGTLYGRNTTGGAIKIISAQPTDAFAAGLTVEGGRFGRVDAEGYVSGPASNSIRVRLSGATAHGGDWQVNRETGEEIGSAEQYALRGLVAADLAPDVEAIFNLHGFIDQSDGLGLQLFNDSVFGPLAHAGRRETSFGSSTTFANLIGIDEGQHPFRDNEGWGTSLTLNAGLGDVTLTYIGAYEVLNRKEFNDFDALTVGGAGVYFETSADVMSHELRLSGDTGRLNWVGGLYYSKEDLNELYQSDFVASFGPGFAVTTPYNQNARTLAAYIHGDYALTETLSIIAGVRYEDENRALRDLGTFSVGTGPLNFANGTIDGTLENRDLNSDNVSGKIGIELTPADNLLLYANYSRGVKSGGFTAYNTLNPNALTPFQPEKLNAYEAGFKSNLNDALQLNGAIFFYDYKDQQVQSAIFDAGTGAVVGRIVNADSEIWGAELEAVLNPAPWLTIGQSLGYKDGEFTDFDDLDIAATTLAGMEVLIDRSGQDLGFPNWSYQGFATAETAIAEGWIASARFDYSYRDDLALPLLGPAFAVDDYWLANAQVAFGPEDGRWELALWGRNIFNADYDETRNFFITGGAADVAAPGMPVTYGARVSVRY
ncbi:TonB-dependent receptor [Hyphococcus flavus]|uniref:TonB-dependent receptor n=1 Tax=Hyphococcus flavus TaxID=1866326 RepID=A0AAE9ZBA6_9PROT|nr:TonB-dependent receptor [Hyphococcus flavus]WDI31479.1 TonB-dependent receptor [Hyphococcus flavus]